MTLCVVVVIYHLFYPRVPPKPCYLSNSLQGVTAPNTVVYPKKRFNGVTLVFLCYFFNLPITCFLWLTVKAFLGLVRRIPVFMFDVGVTLLDERRSHLTEQCNIMKIVLDYDLICALVLSVNILANKCCYVSGITICKLLKFFTSMI
jgi:hypothetical protein